MTSEVGLQQLFPNLEVPQLICHRILEQVPLNVQLRAVSRAWQASLDEPSFVRSLLDRDVLPIEYAVRAGRDVPSMYVKHLNLKRMPLDDQKLREYCNKYPDLESLNLNGCHKLTAEGLKQVASLKHLKSLSVLGLQPDPIWLSSLRVNSIALGNHDGIGDFHLAAIFDRLDEIKKLTLRKIKIKGFTLECRQNVQHIDVRGSPIDLIIHGAALQTLKCTRSISLDSNFRELTSLNLSGIPLENLDFLRNSPHLKKLAVPNTGLKPIAFEDILGRLTSLNAIGCSLGKQNFESMKKIRKLKVSHVSSEEMEALTRTALKLAYIYVDQGQFSNDNLKSLFELKNIRTVILMNCYGLQEVDDLPKNQDVHELGLDGCTEFGDEQLEKILASFDHLFYLSLFGTGVSTEGLEKAQEVLAKLLSLSLPETIQQIPPSLQQCVKSYKNR